MPLTRRRLIALEAASAAALVAAALLERRREGVQLELLLVALVTAVSHVKRLLGLAPRLPALLLEAGALGLLFADYPPPPWALTAASAALLLDRPSREEIEKPPFWLRVSGGLSLVGAVVALAFRIRQVQPFDDFWQCQSALLAAALAPVLLEALFGPASREASLRRAGVGAVFVAASSRVSFTGELLATGFFALAALVGLLAARAPEAQKEKTRRRAVLRIGVLVGVFALVWGLGEVAFHVVPNRYREIATPHMETHHKPGAVFIYEGAPLGPRQPKPVLVYQNKLGYHDVDHELAKPVGTARVLVLGDSFIDAVQVEQEELFHRRIQAALNARREVPVEAIALANSGWGQADELDALEKQGLAYSPDLVVLEFLPSNDVRNNHPELERLVGEEIERSSFARPLYAHAIDKKLFFTAFVLDHLDLTIRNLRGRRESTDAHVYRKDPPRPELWKEAWARTEDLVAKIQSRCREHGAGLVVVIFAAHHELDGLARKDSPPGAGGLELHRPAERMLEICARHGIPCLDLTPRNLALKDWADLHGTRDAHWTAYGHERAAAETVAFLTSETTLWKETVERVQKARAK